MTKDDLAARTVALRKEILAARTLKELGVTNQKLKQLENDASKQRFRERQLRMLAALEEAYDFGQDEDGTI